MFRSLKINCCTSGTSRLRCFIKTPHSTGNGESVSVLSWILLFLKMWKLQLSWPLCYQACVCMAACRNFQKSDWVRCCMTSARLWLPQTPPGFLNVFLKERSLTFSGFSLLWGGEELSRWISFHGSMFSSALWKVSFYVSTHFLTLWIIIINERDN